MWLLWLVVWTHGQLCGYWLSGPLDCCVVDAVLRRLMSVRSCREYRLDTFTHYQQLSLPANATMTTPSTHHSSATTATTARGVKRGHAHVTASASDDDDDDDVSQVTSHQQQQQEEGCEASDSVSTRLQHQHMTTAADT